MDRQTPKLLILSSIIWMVLAPTAGHSYDYDACRHYYMAAKAYMKMLKLDAAKEELRKYDQHRCPSNVSWE